MNESQDLVAQLMANEAFQAFCRENTASQSAYWAEWAAQEAGRPEILRQAQEELRLLQLQPTAAEVDAELEKLRQRYQQPAHSSLPQIRTRKRKLLRAWSAAAAVLLLVVAFFLFRPSGAELLMAELETATATTDSLLLGDGTSVQLNANSKLRYFADWEAGDPREVWLEGEAFFKVSKQAADNSTRFTIHTAQGDVTVLGTAFSLYQRADQLELVLVEGSVAIATPQSEVLRLEAGERAWKNSQGPLQHETVEVDAYIAWTKGRLVFRDMPLSRVVSRLADDYGLELVISSPALLEKRVNANMRSDDPFALAKALATIYDLDLEVSPDSTRLVLTE